MDSLTSTHQSSLSMSKYIPWYNGISDMLKVAKIKRRTVERHWLTSGLTVHKEIHVASKRKLLKFSMMLNWPISAPKLQTAQTANSFFMSLINSCEDRNPHLFLPQFPLTVFLGNFLLYLHDKSRYYHESTRLWNITCPCVTL